MFANFKEKVVSFIINNPWKALLGFLLFSLMILPGLSLLDTDFTYKAWYNDKDPNVKRFEEFERKFGNDDNLIIIIHNPKGVINQRTLQAVDDFTEKLWLTDEISRVDSLNNFQYVESVDDELIIGNLVEKNSLENFSESKVEELKSKIRKKTILEGYFISKDFKTTLIHAYVRPALESIPDHSAISQDVRGKLEQFNKKYPELTTHMYGQVMVVDDFKVATINDLSLLIPLLYSLLCLILYWKYRSVTTIILTLGAISISTLLMLSVAGYLGYKINTLTSVCPTVLMTVALSDAIHIFSAYFIGLRSGFNFKSSLRYSLRKNFYPTLLTSLTTGVGFLSFFDALVRPVAELGINVAFGVFFAWVVTYFGLAPLIFILEKKFKKFETGNKELNHIESEIRPNSFSIKIGNTVDKFRYPILLISTVLCGLGLFFTSKLQVNMDPVEQFGENHRTVRANHFLKNALGFSSGLEMTMEDSRGEAKSPRFLKDVDSFTEWLKNDPEISKVSSIVNVVKDLNQAFHGGDSSYYTIPQNKKSVAELLFFYGLGLPVGKSLNNLISTDSREIHLSLLWNLSDSHGSLKKMSEIEQEAKRRGLNLKITGKTPLFHDLTPYVVKTFFNSFALAFIGITLILIFSLRSILLGFLSMIPNTFPLLVGGGLFYLTGYDVDMGTVLVASVCLGIAVDDSIHFLFEFQKYKGRGKSTLEAIQTLAFSTYPALFMTTLVLSIGFASFVFGSYIPNIKFGVCVALILLIALVADFVILPAVLLVFQRREKN